MFDTDARAVRARRVRRLGAIALSSEPRQLRAGEDASAVLSRGIAGLGANALPWSKAQLQLRSRVAFLRAADSEWPDLSDGALTANLEQWLGRYLGGKTRLSEIDAAVLDQALNGLLPWPMRQRLDAEAPTHFEAPTGNRHALDYEGAGAPALHIRFQELYGFRAPDDSARTSAAKVLSFVARRRPIQITRDLPGFWSGHGRRYDRHARPISKHVGRQIRPMRHHGRAKPRGT